MIRTIQSCCTWNQTEVSYISSILFFSNIKFPKPFYITSQWLICFYFLKTFFCFITKEQHYIFFAFIKYCFRINKISICTTFYKPVHIELIFNLATISWTQFFIRDIYKIPIIIFIISHYICISIFTPRTF